MSNLGTPPEEWLAELFEFEWCAECGRGAAGHTAIPFMGNWFGRCDNPPQFDGSGNLIMNPGGEPDGDADSYRYGAEGQSIRAEIFDAEARGDWDAVHDGESRLVDLKLGESGNEA